MYILLIRKLLFYLDPEVAHRLSFNALKILGKIPGLLFSLRLIFDRSTKRSAVQIESLLFKNKIGLAAGFDKNAELINELSSFGFSFIEVGAITPRPQKGNSKPRIFRLLQDEALINRMAFNNLGLKKIAMNLKNTNTKGVIVGCNIGKNKDTPLQDAYKDYVRCLAGLHKFADYFAINISSPNTPSLRLLHQDNFLPQLLSKIQNYNNSTGKPKPIFLKISPDLTFPELEEIILSAHNYKLTGLIVANTTMSRPLTLNSSKTLINEIGGLSGKPLTDTTINLIKYVAGRTDSLKIIASGGIFSSNDALAMLNAGAHLLQVYTSFIYKGPGLIKKLTRI